RAPFRGLLHIGAGSSWSIGVIFQVPAHRSSFVLAHRDTGATVLAPRHWQPTRSAAHSIPERRVPAKRKCRIVVTTREPGTGCMKHRPSPHRAADRQAGSAKKALGRFRNGTAESRARTRNR